MNADKFIHKLTIKKVTKCIDKEIKYIDLIINEKGQSKKHEDQKALLKYLKNKIGELK